MADETKQANYQEVLEVSIDPKPFQTGLNTLAQMYEQWLADLGDEAAGVLGVGLVQGMQDASKASKAFSLEFAKTMLTLGTQLDNFAEKFGTKLDSVLDHAASKAKHVTKEIADDFDELESNNTSGPADGSERPAPPRRRSRQVSDEQKFINSQTASGSNVPGSKLPTMEQRAEKFYANFEAGGSYKQPSILAGALNTREIQEFLSSIVKFHPNGAAGEVATHDSLTNQNSASSLRWQAALAKTEESIQVLKAQLASLQMPSDLATRVADLNAKFERLTADAKRFERAIREADANEVVDSRSVEGLAATLKQQVGVMKEIQGIREATGKTDVRWAQQWVNILHEVGAELDKDRQKQEAAAAKLTAAGQKQAGTIRAQVSNGINENDVKVAQQWASIIQDVGVELERDRQKAAARTAKLEGEGQKQGTDNRAAAAKEIASAEADTNKQLQTYTELLDTAAVKEQNLAIARLKNDPAAQLKLYLDLLKQVQAELSAIKGEKVNVGDLSELNTLQERHNSLVTRETQLTAGLDSARTRLAAKEKADIQHVSTLQERFNSELSKTNQLENKLTNTHFGNDLQEQLRAVQQQAAEARNELARLAQVKPGAGVASEGGLKNLQTYNTALRNVISTEKELHRVQDAVGKATQSFWKGLKGDMGDAFLTAAKFTIAYRLINVALEGIGAALSAPFKAIADGMHYLEDLEDKTRDLSAVIAMNVKYSEDYAENFRISQEVGVQAMQALQQKAIEAQVPIENLTKTFKALLEAKAIGAVNSMQELVTLAAEMQAVVEHLAPKGMFGGANFEKDVVNLFNGHADQNNLFLKTTQTTVTEWEKLLAHGRKFHDLLTQLEPKLRPLLDAFGKAQLTMSVIKEQLELIMHQINAGAAAPLFDMLEQSLKSVNTWLKENEAWIKGVVVQVGNLGRSFLDLGGQLVRLGAQTGFFRALYTTVGGLVWLCSSLTTTIAAMVDQTISGAQYLLAYFKDHDYQKALSISDGLDERQADRFKRTKESLAMLLDPEHEPKTKDRMNDHADANGDALDTKSAAKEAKAEFEQAKSEYDLAMERLEDGFATMRERAEENVTLGVKSHTQAFMDLTQAHLEQIRLFDTASADIVNKAKAAKDKIAGDTTRSAIDKQPDIQNAQKAVNDLQRGIEKKRLQLFKSFAPLGLASLQENNSIFRETEIEQPNRTTQALIQSQREAVQQAAAEQRLTAISQFDLERELDARSHSALMYKLSEEERVSRTVGLFDSEAHIKALAAKTEAEQEWTRTLLSEARRRAELVYQEELRDEADADARRAAALATQRTRAALSSSVSGRPGEFSNEKAQLYAARKADLNLLIQQGEQALAVAKGRNAESDATEKLTLALERLHQERLVLLQDEINERTAGMDQTGRRLVAGHVATEHAKALEKDRAQTQSDLATLKSEAGSGPLISSDLSDRIQSLQEHLDGVNSSLKDAQHIIGATTMTMADFGKSLADTLLGPGFTELWKDGEKGQALAQGARFGVASASTEVGIFKNAAQDNGTAAGIGALLSKGPVAEAIGKIPIAGPIINAVGSIVELAASAFHAGARKIAEQIRDQFEATSRQISSGVLGLGAGINTVQAEMTEAITRLTAKSKEGMGGGQRFLQNALGGPVFGNAFNWFGNGAMDELSKLLPPMIEKMQEILRQQAQVFQEFNNQLKSLKLQSDTLSGINSQWQSINTEVAKYLDAGGDQEKANEMLQLGLKEIERQIGSELISGYDQAVQDAIQLNDLALRRYQMQQDFKAQEFNLINADSAERMQAGAVTRGQQLAKLREAFQQQMDDINSQISLESKKVDSERKIFDIATTISDLHRQDEKLQLAALDLQLQKYRDLQNAVATIGSGAATPGKGDANLAAQLNSIDQQITTLSAKLQGDVASNKQGDSGRDTTALQQLLSRQKQLEASLAASAGGTLVGTGVEGVDLSAIESAQAAIAQQATFAAKHPDTDTGGWKQNLGQYLAMLNALATQLATQQASLLGGSTTIGTGASSISASQLNMSGLAAILKTSGLSGSNTSNITINVAANTAADARSIASAVSDAISSELMRQSRQAISF